MIKSLLFTPFLWLRKIVVYLLIILLALGLVFYFIANSPLVIKKVADTFAPDYNISYSRIYGNVITGVKIENLKYKNNPLAEHITLKWNPGGLAKKEIIVNKVEIDKANVDTIKALIASFPDSEENVSSEPFSFGIKVEQVSVNIDPFIEQGIHFNSIALELKDLYYSNEALDIRALSLMVDSNISTLVLNASIHKGVVDVQKLALKEVNTVALETLFMADNDDTNDTQKLSSLEENSTQDEVSNPYIPHSVHIDNLAINVLPRVFEPVQIKALGVNISDATFNVPSLELQKAKVTLKGSTNFSDLSYDANVKNNEITGLLQLIPMEELFRHYNLPLRKEAIGTINIELNASKTSVIAHLNTQMKHLLKADKDAFNVDVEHLTSIVMYDIDKTQMKADTKAIVSTPYAKDIAISNLFVFNDQIRYSGKISVKQIIGMDAKFTKPLNNLTVGYTGDTQSIQTKIDTNNLQGTFTSEDFKQANLHIENKQEIILNKYVKLPLELNQTKVNIVLDAPISFENNASYLALAKISSNVVNVDANLSYKDILKVNSVIHIPEVSLIKSYSKEVKWDNLNPIRIDAKLLKDRVDTTLNAGILNAKAQFEFESTKVDGLVTLGGLKADISGNAKEKMSIHTNIHSMPQLVESIGGIYTFGELPVIKGSAELFLVLDNMKNAEVIFSSPYISYQADHKTEHIIEDIDLQVAMTESEILLTGYSLTYANQKIFATTPSVVLVKDDVVTISPLWMNDQLKVDGNYSLKTKSGTISTQADKLHIAHEIIDLDTAVDLKTNLDGNKTDIKGKVILLGGNIHYDINQKTFASDSDILIVQDIKKEEPNVFMDNLGVEIQVQTKKPLVYNKDNINIQANVDLGIHKIKNSELMVLGSVELLKGGSYIFEGKKFVLDKSFVYFTGNPNKPLLEVSVHYQALHHLITILITGSADRPNINFSSKPSLSKEQILSVILFDSEAGAGTNSGDEMMKMMGGAMAKSALSDLGVKLDHLVLGAGNSVEVGKKLTDDITIIYVNDVVSSVKLKYEHSRHTESVISASEKSQSYDIIYKKDF